MSPGDPEAPNIPKVSVLKVAKKEAVDEEYLDKDPIDSLYI